MSMTLSSDTGKLARERVMVVRGYNCHDKNSRLGSSRSTGTMQLIFLVSFNIITTNGQPGMLIISSFCQ